MKLPHRRRFLHLVATAAALPAVSRFARAQAYPTRPVRLIVGFAAGGNADTTARVMGRWLSAPVWDVWRARGGGRGAPAAGGGALFVGVWGGGGHPPPPRPRDGAMAVG